MRGVRSASLAPLPFVLAFVALLAVSAAPAAAQEAAGSPPAALAIARDLAETPGEAGPPDALSSAAAAGPFAHVVPIVLSVSGMGGSFFTTELTFTNRSAVEVELELAYTAAFGTGSGTVRDRLSARSQKTHPDAISYLRSLGLPIPQGQNAGGPLRVTFVGLPAPTDATISARTGLRTT